jgi:hypothetical protein
MVKKTIPAQQAFETSGQALAILTDIFRDLQSACSLKEVSLGIKRCPLRIGAPWKLTLLPRVMGLHRMLESIGFPNSIVKQAELQFVGWLEQGDFGAYFLPVRNNLACRAIRQSGFKKHVIRVEVGKGSFTSGSSQYPFPRIFNSPPMGSPHLAVALADGDT